MFRYMCVLVLVQSRGPLKKPVPSRNIEITGPFEKKRPRSRPVPQDRTNTGVCVCAWACAHVQVFFLILLFFLFPFFLLFLLLLPLSSSWLSSSLPWWLSSSIVAVDCLRRRGLYRCLFRLSLPKIMYGSIVWRCFDIVWSTIGRVLISLSLNSSAGESLLMSTFLEFGPLRPSLGDAFGITLWEREILITQTHIHAFRRMCTCTRMHLRAHVHGHTQTCANWQTRANASSTYWAF